MFLQFLSYVWKYALPLQCIECFVCQGLSLNLFYYVPFPFGQLMCALQHRVGILFLVCFFTL